MLIQCLPHHDKGLKVILWVVSCITVDIVFLPSPPCPSTARNFINRATLTSSYEEIQKILQEVPCSSGFSLNVGTFKDDMMISNFEVAPSGVVETKIKGYGYHFNM